MTATEMLVGPLAGLIDKIVTDPKARDEATLRLLELQRLHGLDALNAQLSTLRDPPDRWTRRARPTFLYVMYALLLWSIPMGLVAAVQPALAAAIARGMTAYLSALPEPLYALFGTGYVGYTVARQWGKAKGGER